MNRPILSYSDISPSSASNNQFHRGGHPRGRGGGASSGGGRGFSGSGGEGGRWKKRKFRESAEHERTHWDAQGQKNDGDVTVTYDGDTQPPNLPLKGEAEASVVLTDQGSWDDAELIDAWDAAMEEYRRMNGPTKDWKTEPVHKGSIWYNMSERMQWKDVPVKPPAVQTRLETDGYNPADADEVDDGETGADGDVEDLAMDTEDYKAVFESLPGFETMTKDELFQKAVESSYWAGYWAAAYHASKVTKS